MKHFLPKMLRTKNSTIHHNHFFTHQVISNIIYISAFLDSTASFVYNYKPANFEEDFISALTALVTAQDDPQRLKELTEGTKSILNDYQNELPEVLRQVKTNFLLRTLTVSLHN